MAGEIMLFVRAGVMAAWPISSLCAFILGCHCDFFEVQ
jgi:hypothetical protein